MIEEPYRWVEAINNRRDYIEGQLSAGSPIVALSCEAGILVVTFSRDHQKLFEVYDRIALGAMGHPGDIERLRIAAIEIASTEGFTRSPLDVSLRRMVNFGLSPALKAAFEQVYGPPYIARLLFVELGRNGVESDLLARVDYDGSVATNGATFARARRHYAVISGNSRSMERMELLLKDSFFASVELKEALRQGVDALVTGILALPEDAPKEAPSQEILMQERTKQLENSGVEAILLDRHGKRIAYRALSRDEIQNFLQ